MGERLNVNIQKKIGKKLLSKKSCLKKSISHYFSSQLFFPFLSNIIMVQSKTNFAGLPFGFFEDAYQKQNGWPIGPLMVFVNIKEHIFLKFYNLNEFFQKFIVVNLAFYRIFGGFTLFGIT